MAPMKTPKNSHRSRFALIAIIGTLVVGLFAPAAASAVVTGRKPAPKSSRVILILAPYVLWDDITAEFTPSIWSAVQDGATGSVNSRSRTKDDDGGPSVVEGVLTISAGAWALPDKAAFAAYDVRERFEYDSAGEAFQRLTGVPVGEYQSVYLGGPSTERVNAANSYDISLGVLGQAIEDAGGTTAAIGNSDLGYSSNVTRVIRPAAIAAMNGDGAVRFGSVGDSMLLQDPDAPYGVRTNLEAVAGQLAVVAEGSAAFKSSLVVVDPGDLFRANQYAGVVAPTVAEQQWRDALMTLDECYRLSAQQFPDATIIVTSLASVDRAQQREGFGPLIIKNMPAGILTSNSTQRPGLTVSPDITATIIDVLGAEQPVQVVGAPVESTRTYSKGLVLPTEDTAENRLDFLGKMNGLAVSLDATRAAILNWFIGLTVAILAFGAFVVVRADKHWKPKTVAVARSSLYLLMTAVLSVLASSWLMFFFYRWPSTPTAMVSQLLFVSLGVWLATIGVGKFAGQRASLVFLAVITTVVVIVDQLLGAPASFASFFGYSPISAARFYGIGNEGAAVLFGTVVVGIALALDEWPGARWTDWMRRWGVPLIGAVVLFVSGAPMLGANVGVAAWGSVGFVLMWVLLNDKPVNIKTIALMALVVLVLLAAFIALDRFGSGQETHLSRSIASAEQGGLGQLWDIVVRKAQTNLRVLTRTNFAYILVAVIFYLAFMRWRPSRDFARTLAANPSFSQAMIVVLVAGFAAYFTEDSGIVLPALMVLYLGCALVWLMLRPLVGTEPAEVVEE